MKEIISIKPKKIFLSGFWKSEDLNEIKMIIEFLRSKDINGVT